VTTVAITNIVIVSNVDRTAVINAWSFRRREVWRYTKIDAKTIAAAGSKNVAAKSKLGEGASLSEEKNASRITTQDPAPKIAASKEAQIMSFSRILFSPDS
jgi:hypothetical protein